MSEWAIQKPSRAFGALIQRMSGGAERADDRSDEALALRVRAHGDTEAFALLVTRYRGRVVALARRLLDTARDEAEDVAQEAFVAAYDKRASFRPGASFRPWLYRIAVNRCLDRQRAQARRPAFVPLDTASEPAEEGAGPLATLLTDERERRLNQAVAALPTHYRIVFLLRHLDDLTYEEIAQATGQPLGTVKTHLFRARAALRHALTGYLDE